MSYFEKIILPSVDLPQKPSYNLAEVEVIFGVNERSIKRKAKLGQLEIIENRVSFEELVKFFAQSVKVKENWGSGKSLALITETLPVRFS